MKDLNISMKWIPEVDNDLEKACLLSIPKVDDQSLEVMARRSKNSNITAMLTFAKMADAISKGEVSISNNLKNINYDYDQVAMGEIFIDRLKK